MLLLKGLILSKAILSLGLKSEVTFMKLFPSSASFAAKTGQFALQSTFWSVEPMKFFLFFPFP
jgi:hypothetical protein